MAKMFEDILEKNEKIVKILKPSKTKYWTSTMLFTFILSIWVYTILPIAYANKEGLFDVTLFWILLGSATGSFILIFILDGFSEV